MSIGAPIIAAPFVNPPDAGSGPVSHDEFVPILADILYRFQIVQDLMETADSAANAAVTAATDAGGQAAKNGENVKLITQHIIDVIIPHSTAWAIGYIVSKYIEPILRRLNQDETRLGILEGFRRSTDTWRYKYVDPNIKDWRAWHEWWLGWPQGVVFRVHQWLEQPAVFGDWAAPAIARPLVAWFADRRNAAIRDVLSRTMAQAWRDDAGVVWDDVMAFLLADT